MVAELGTIETGQYPINKIALDRSGTRAIAASDDGSIKVLNMKTFKQEGELHGHESAVQSVAIAPNDAFFVSGSSDSTFKIWAK